LQQEDALDPFGMLTLLRSQITNFEIRLQERKLRPRALQDNLRPNPAKLSNLLDEIERLEDLLVELNTEMVTTAQGE
jgi:capsular polysaccharide transport system permease protein